MLVNLKILWKILNFMGNKMMCGKKMEMFFNLDIIKFK